MNKPSNTKKQLSQKDLARVNQELQDAFGSWSEKLCLADLKKSQRKLEAYYKNKKYDSGGPMAETLNIRFP